MPVTNIKTKRVLIYVIFLIVKVGSNTTFTYFSNKKRYLFLYNIYSFNFIINLLSDLLVLSGNYSKNLIITLKLCFV